MTRLRERMLEYLQLRGLSEKTQESYLRAVRQLAEHYGRPPDTLSDEELRQYFLYLRNVKVASTSTYRIALYGIRFFYLNTLQLDWPKLAFIRLPKETKLPVLLSFEEVRRVLGCLRRLRYRVCLSSIYSCGLRLNEGVHLQLAVVDSDRMQLHVKQGKGAQDRFVPLPQRTLELLRQYWSLHQHDAVCT